MTGDRQLRLTDGERAIDVRDRIVLEARAGRLRKVVRIAAGVGGRSEAGDAVDAVRAKQAVDRVVVGLFLRRVGGGCVIAGDGQRRAADIERAVDISDRIVAEPGAGRARQVVDIDADIRCGGEAGDVFDGVGAEQPLDGVVVCLHACRIDSRSRAARDGQFGRRDGDQAVDIGNCVVAEAGTGRARKIVGVGSGVGPGRET